MPDHVVTSFEPENLYASPRPWDIGRPQAAFLELVEQGAIRGRVLDVGCGTGEHVLMCAQRGLAATGIDLAEPALDTAREKARECGLSARFLCHDALRLADLGETFDIVIDCGLFHMPHFTSADRSTFVTGLASALSDSGCYLMLCFSDRAPEGGPHRITRDQINSWFATGWQLDLAPASIEVTIDPAGFPAWLVRARKT